MCQLPSRSRNSTENKVDKNHIYLESRCLWTCSAMVFVSWRYQGEKNIVVAPIPALPLPLFKILGNIAIGFFILCMHIRSLAYTRHCARYPSYIKINNFGPELKEIYGLQKEMKLG